MAGVDEKTKRFRLHVVEEIFQTEKDYTRALNFTVEVSKTIITSFIEQYTWFHFRLLLPYLLLTNTYFLPT